MGRLKFGDGKIVSRRILLMCCASERYTPDPDGIARFMSVHVTNLPTQKTIKKETGFRAESSQCSKVCAAEVEHGLSGST